MGQVYRARHVRLPRTFAVKILRATLTRDSALVARFEREAELVGRLAHPNIVGIIDAGETEAGERYLVMEYVPGQPLTALIGSPMPVARVATIAGQIAAGLAHAHGRGLVHRDLKPENVVVETTADGDPIARIIDFGIALELAPPVESTRTRRLTMEGLIIGTPHYMAPEHACGSPLDHRADLFSLGVIVFELLTGRSPFDGEGMAVASANVHQPTPAMGQRVHFLDVDPVMEALTRRLLEKEPAARLDSAHEAQRLFGLAITDRAAAAAALGIELEPAGRRRRRSALPPLR